MERFIKLKEDMNAHSMLEYPKECVGIITKDFIYIPCTHVLKISYIGFIDF